jgi:hypothetical protein
MAEQRPEQFMSAMRGREREREREKMKQDQDTPKE